MDQHHSNCLVSMLDQVCRVSGRGSVPGENPGWNLSMSPAWTRSVWRKYSSSGPTSSTAEAQAFEDGARPAGFVRGKPAIFTTNPYPPLDSFAAGQNSGALVWESAPDEVTSIGYDGSATEKEAIEVLRALADKGTVLSPAQWLSRDRAPVG
jgi:hypothetical protein